MRRDARLARHRFHLIDAGRFTSSLAPESKGKPDLELLTYLHGAGRSETEKWLARSRSSIGRRSTVDFAKDLLLGRPGAAAPAARAALAAWGSRVAAARVIPALVGGQRRRGAILSSPTGAAGRTRG